MININNIINKYNIHPKKIIYYKSYIILDNEYLIKDKDSNKKELFNILKEINYNYYLPIINNYNDSYEIYKYYPNTIDDKDIKIKYLLEALITLHSNTIYYEELTTKDYNNIYEYYKNIINNTMAYYLDIQDNIEEELFPRIDYYYLLLSISKIHKIIRLAEEKLDNWFNYNNKRIRKSIIIDNNSLDNFIVGNKIYFIDYKNSRKDILIYDLVNLYKNNYKDIDMISILNTYENKINISIDEIYLFEALICIPEKLVFNNTIYQNTINIDNLFNYIDKANNIVLEEDKKYQKTNKEEFKE